MRKVPLWIGVILIIVFSINPESSRAQYNSEDNREFLIETFDTLKVGEPPMYWRHRDGKITLGEMDEDRRAGYFYSVKQENTRDGRVNQFLRFEGVKGNHINYPLKHSGIDIYETPYLNWNWRAVLLPEGGNEDEKNANDSVLSLYVVYKMTFPRIPRVIRYSWSSTLEPGTVLTKNFGRMKIVILESGATNAGEWITFKRNVLKDYQELFGGDPPHEPLALLILSDGNDVDKLVIGDYDELYFSAK